MLRLDDAHTSHECPTREHYAARQLEILARKEARTGLPHPVTRVAEPLVVTAASPLKLRVVHNRWTFDCPCGNCPIPFKDGQTGEGRCFECGAWYPHVLFPDADGAIEAVLVKRPRIENRNWLGETLDELAAENVANGVI